MERKKYQEIVKKYTPKENRLYNGLIAFITGGIVGVIGELLLNFYAYIFHISTKDASSFMIVTLIFISAFCTCLGFFDKLVNFCKAGLIVPITGFAHAMMSAALDYKKEGLVTGIGANMFKLAGSVIIFGVCSAYFFGIIRILIFGG